MSQRFSVSISIQIISARQQVAEKPRTLSFRGAVGDEESRLMSRPRLYGAARVLRLPSGRRIISVPSKGMTP